MARSVVSARRFVGRKVSRVCRRRVYRWFWAPVEQPLVDVLLPAGFEFTRGTEEDLPLLAQVGADFARARDFLAAGHRLWLVRRGDQVAFSGWIFLGSAPTDSVRTGWMPLDDDLGNHEDTNTHPDFRGRGLAVIARQLMAADLARDGVVTHVVTGILANNTSSLRVTAKSLGWREFAVVEMTKIGLLRRGARRGQRPTQPPPPPPPPPPRPARR